ncbi:hypothetical protein A0H81_10873 [Grifola frondosa]|uniref:Uncharacterized protein n=1 Tax=Grifola frondosa TaxID=5627 RepID=A0A1C7LWN3_GRIFR|nr:hypothetical protein A0H81_10873 [Grifola frondosa]
MSSRELEVRCVLQGRVDEPGRDGGRGAAAAESDGWGYVGGGYLAFAGMCEMGGRMLFREKEGRWSWEGGGRVEEGKSCRWGGY